MIHADVKFGSQFIEHKIDRKTVNKGFRPETDDFNSKEKCNKDETFTAESRKANDEKSTGNPKDERISLEVLN